ncbi:hypothetical protein Ait01nite_042350 [Actinoplanes italicus]|nr:hypothetical protein Ait01nite_042350 [Actinoplanes italicus]
MAFCGSSLTSGTRPLTPGWNIAAAAPLTAEQAISRVIDGVPVKNATATTACAASRTRSAPSISGRAPMRSDNTPPKRMNPRNGTIHAASTKPTPVAP